jgi:Mo-dependent nitrogenase C-terminus
MLSSGNSSSLDPHLSSHSKLQFRPLNPIRSWLSALPINDPRRAEFLCKLIPSQCPFERDVDLLGLHFHIPALCKLNPVYEELVMLRFRALCFLVDECGVDVTPYCQ